MENKALRKLTKHHVFMIIYGVIALSAIAVFWIFKDNPIATIYDMAALWLVLPIGSMIISYSMTAERGPKGVIWLLPLAFGAAMCVVEFLTFSLAEIIEGGTKMPSITLLVIGAFASLVGFTFAKQDRVEKERAERAKKKKEAKAGKKLGVVGEATDAAEENIPETVAHEDDYNPGADFIPDEDDTWADEVLEREGYGKEQVEYAQSDADFSIDLPEENGSAAPVETEAEESAENVTESAEETENEPKEAKDEDEPDTSSEEAEIEETPVADEDEADAPGEEGAAEEAEESAAETEYVPEGDLSNEACEESGETDE